MSIQPELEAKILRYYHVEKWRVGTIARQLQLHHGTVERVLAARACRRRNTLREHPKPTRTCRLSAKHWSAFQR